MDSEKTKESQVKRVARLAKELVLEIHGLPTEALTFLKESFGVDNPTQNLYAIHDGLTVWQGARRCERCKKPINTKGRGSNQRFCSRTCRTMEYKRRRKERETANEFVGGEAASEAVAKVIEPQVAAKPKAKATRRTGSGKTTVAAIEPMSETVLEVGEAAICECCGKEFIRNEKKQKFCSNSCRANQWRKDKRKAAKAMAAN